MIDYLILGIALIGTLIGSYTDIKIREVSNWLSYGLILAMVLLRGIEGFLIGDFSGFILSIIVGSVFFLFGLIMFYMQQWGGADLKLLTMLGIGFSVPLTEFNPIYSGIWPVYLTVLMNFFILAAAYSILYVVGLAIRNPKILNDFKANLNRNEIFISMGLLIVIASLGILNSIFYFLLLFPPLWFVLKYLKLIETNYLKKERKISELSEFDVPIEDIVIDDKLFISSRNPNGLTVEQIKKLQKLSKKGKFKKSIVVKWGLPLIPVFPLTILATVFIGDLLIAAINLFA